MYMYISIRLSALSFSGWRKVGYENMRLKNCQHEK